MRLPENMSYMDILEFSAREAWSPLFGYPAKNVRVSHAQLYEDGVFDIVLSPGGHFQFHNTICTCEICQNTLDRFEKAFTYKEEIRPISKNDLIHPLGPWITSETIGIAVINPTAVGRLYAQN